MYDECNCSFLSDCAWPTDGYKDTLINLIATLLAGCTCDIWEHGGSAGGGSATQWVQPGGRRSARRPAHGPEARAQGCISWSRGFHGGTHGGRTRHDLSLTATHRLPSADSGAQWNGWGHYRKTRLNNQDNHTTGMYRRRCIVVKIFRQCSGILYPALEGPRACRFYFFVHESLISLAPTTRHVHGSTSIERIMLVLWRRRSPSMATQRTVPMPASASWRWCKKRQTTQARGELSFVLKKSLVCCRRELLTYRIKLPFIASSSTVVYHPP